MIAFSVCLMSAVLPQKSFFCQALETSAQIKLNTIWFFFLLLFKTVTAVGNTSPYQRAIRLGRCRLPPTPKLIPHNWRVLNFTPGYRAPALSTLRFPSSSKAERRFIERKSVLVVYELR